MNRSKKKRRREEKRRTLRTLQNRGTQRTAVPSVAVRSPGRLKMSEVIGHLAEPLIEQMVKSPEDMERVIMMTILAWNLTLFPPEQRDENLREATRKVLPDDEAAMSVLSWVCDLVAERKRKYYPHVNHTILDVHFKRQPDDSVYFEVMYNL